MKHEKGDDVSTRRRGTGTGSAGNDGRGGWSRRDFLRATGAFAGLLSLGAAASVVGAEGNGAPGDGGARPSDAPDKKRGFTYRGKKVEVVEDDARRFADLTIDGKRVRAKRVGGMYRAPGFAFVPAHNPDDLARFMIDYRLALAADAAGAAVVPVTVPDGAGHAAGGH